MYKNLAFTNGVIIAIMVFFNGMLSNGTNPYLSTVIFNFVALISIVTIAIIRKNKFTDLRNLSFELLLPGVFNVITVLLNNIAAPKIGITAVLGGSLLAQLVLSSFIEHFGLWDMPVNKFQPQKLVGFSMIAIGIVFMIKM